MKKQKQKRVGGGRKHREKKFCKGGMRKEVNQKRFQPVLHFIMLVIRAHCRLLRKNTNSYYRGVLLSIKGMFKYY